MNQKVLFITAAVCSVVAFMIGRIASNAEVSSSSGANRITDKRGASSSLLEARDKQRKPDITATEAKIRMIAILNHPSRIERMQQWLRFVKGLGPDEYSDTVASFRASGLSNYNPTEYSMLLSEWAKVDPTAAIEYAKNNTGTDFARLTILATWAVNDPEAAMAWAVSNFDGKGSNTWMTAVIRGIASTDPERATELLEANPEVLNNRYDYSALPVLETIYLKRGPDAARAWALSFSDKELRKRAVLGIAERLLITDSVGTLEWLQTIPGEEANAAIGDVMFEFVQNNSQAAMASFDKIADKAVKAKAFGGITNSLAYNDPKAAVAFMNRNPALITDQVVEGFVSFAGADNEPELVANFISRIQNENKRDKIYRDHLEDWLEEDMDALSRWMNQNQDKLSERTKKSLEADIEDARNNQNR